VWPTTAGGYRQRGARPRTRTAWWRAPPSNGGRSPGAEQPHHSVQRMKCGERGRCSVGRCLCVPDSAGSQAKTAYTGSATGVSRDAPPFHARAIGPRAITPRLPLRGCCDYIVCCLHRRTARESACGVGHGRLKRVRRSIISKLGISLSASGDLLPSFSMMATAFRSPGHRHWIGGTEGSPGGAIRSSQS
jgi:hypothetical protein